MNGDNFSKKYRIIEGSTSVVWQNDLGYFQMDIFSLLFNEKKGQKDTLKETTQYQVCSFTDLD